MARIQIQTNPGQFRVVFSPGGTPHVSNGKSGKSKIYIPQKTREQADELCRRLNAGEHDGQVYSHSL
jgi:hypothetical protein